VYAHKINQSSIRYKYQFLLFQPLLISQTKLGGNASPAPAKKRSIEDVDSSPTASQDEQQKKHRPTLLDTKRIKKPSRYESTKDENEGESGEEEGEEEEEEEDDEEDSELDEGEEEEDIDSAAADIEEDDDEDEVGEPIEDPTIEVRGEGSGRDNEAIPQNFMGDYLGSFDYEDDLELSEAIADPVLSVMGEGCGSDCLVGNGKTEATVEETTAKSSEPKATFFFGEPGCLKLSPMKQTPKPETKRSIFDSLSEEKTNGETEKCRESTPPRNGSELKDTSPDADEATASAAATEETNKSQEAEKNTISQEQIKEEECEPVAKQEFKIKVIETNEKISKGQDETEGVEDEVSLSENQKEEVSDPQNHSDEGEPSSFKKEDLCKVVEKEGDAKERVTEAITRENGPVKIENEVSQKDQKNSNNAVGACNDKVSRETTPEVTPTPNQNETRTKTEPDTITNTKETTSSPSTSEMEIQSAQVTNKSKSSIDDVNLLKKNKVRPEGETKSFERAPETLPPDNNSSDLPKNRLGSSSDAIIICNETIKVNSSSPAEDKLKEQVQKEMQGTSKNPNPEEIKKPMDSAEKHKPDAEPLLAREKISVPKPSTLLNRKRRLNDSQPALRNSTSESEVQEEEPHEDDPTADDLDVGGKRIKMRPKTTNVEARRKVEAQKTQIEETTSSSGEEDARSRRKIIVPQTKQKPTLEEIIEKKLKKTAERDLPEKNDKEKTPEKIAEKTLPPPQSVREATPPTSSFSPPKKSPITKPLKKNLLTQLRQEESEEEAIPRKRTNSETIVPAVPAVPVPNATLSHPEERHRKRRSSEDAKESFSKESSPSEPPPSAEKLKRNNEQDIEEEFEDPLASPVRDSPPPVKEQSPPPEGSARRSGRRGGAAVVHSELPQPKRTRGGAREKAQSEVKAEVKQESEDEDEETAKVSAKLKSEVKEDPVKETPSKEKSSDKDDIKEEPKEEPKEKPKVGRGRGPRKKREVDTTNIIEANDSETPVRQSRRIAQQKIKEEAERRKQEEVALRSMKQELKKKKKAEKEADPTVLEPSGEESESEASEAEEEARSKKKKKFPGKDGAWSSDSEEQPESEEEEEEPPHYETDPGSPLFRSDHEFSPESELEDESQAVPMKRARTVRKENADDQEEVRILFWFKKNKFN